VGTPLLEALLLPEEELEEEPDEASLSLLESLRLCAAASAGR
jgi:hypothetical protein